MAIVSLPAATLATEAPLDRLVDVEEAARLLNRPISWLYKHPDLPFRVRDGGHALRYSERGIQEYILRRRG